jgi:phosphoribosylformylglycinamidine cyclo-ligase
MTDYASTGVRGQSAALSAVARHLGALAYPDGVEPLTTFGGYASVLKLSDELALALCTDGVGTKTLVASALGRYDTIGFDCVAMNVNDLICVGARPLALVDYLGVNTLEPGHVNGILKGLAAAAAEAGIVIPGGETAQLPEIIGSDGRSPGNETAFDLVGACVGVLRPEDLIDGRRVRPGDVLIGLASSGIHSNGLTLARRVLLSQAGYSYDDHLPVLGRTLGEELLEPTAIYVRPITALWEAGIETRALAHITGDGFANLCRLRADVGYVIDDLPKRPAIFSLIQEAGGIDEAEMYRVFNLGVGLVVCVPESHVAGALELLGEGARRIGYVSDEAGVVRIEPAGLVGGMRAGDSYFEPA